VKKCLASVELESFIALLTRVRKLEELCATSQHTLSYGERLLTIRQIPNWRAAHSRLSVADYYVCT
jgi:hypothetical protein